MRMVLRRIYECALLVAVIETLLRSKTLQQLDPEAIVCHNACNIDIVIFDYFSPPVIEAIQASFTILWNRNKEAINTTH